jgi:hypothetical protein
MPTSALANVSRDRSMTDQMQQNGRTERKAEERARMGRWGRGGCDGCVCFVDNDTHGCGDGCVCFSAAVAGARSFTTTTLGLQGDRSSAHLCENEHTSRSAPEVSVRFAFLCRSGARSRARGIVHLKRHRGERSANSNSKTAHGRSTRAVRRWRGGYSRARRVEHTVGHAGSIAPPRLVVLVP